MQLFYAAFLSLSIAQDAFALPMNNVLTVSSIDQSLTPASLGCKLGGIELQAFYAGTNTTDMRSGFHADVFPNPNDPREKIKRIRCDSKPGSSFKITHELEALKKVKQLVKCLFTDSGDHRQVYYIYMKNIPEHRLATALEVQAFEEDIKIPKTPVYETFKKLIREKVIQYAERDGVGHADIKSSNIRFKGTSLENLQIDLIDWGTWVRVPIGDSDALQAYIHKYLDPVFPALLKDLEFASRTTSAVTSNKGTPGGSPNQASGHLPKGSPGGSPSQASGHLPSSSTSGGHSPNRS